MSVTDEIKSRIDIVDIISETVKLRRTGKSYSGFCPFHENSRTPAFAVFPDTGTWHCFGCNEGGDIFKFLMKKENWDFPQALKYLAQRAGVELEPLTPKKKEDDEKLERLHALLEETVTFFHHHLLQNPAGSIALAYLTKRGLETSTIANFGLGYAPASWDETQNYLTGKGYSIQELLLTGLVTERQNAPGVYDRFRNRIMFPIRNVMGKTSGFGARSLEADDVPKYLNSPQTELFDKGKTLFGLNLAYKTIRTMNQAVIVEGYMDVIALHQAGFSNAVSPMGTALSEDQLRQLKRYTRQIILALDADAAGEQATLRGLEVARQALDHTNEIVFDARGLLRHEARLQADLRVTTLPEGKDPDEIVLQDKQEWKRIIDSAQPIVLHVMHTLALGRDLEDPKVKSDIAAQVLPLIGDIPNSVEREAYRQRLARMLKIDERSLISPQSTQTQSKVRKTYPKPSLKDTIIVPQVGSIQFLQSMEAQCLRLILRKPDSVDLLNRFLQKAGLNRLSPQDFEYTDYQLLARVVQQSLEQDDLDPSHYIQENTPETLQSLAQDLLIPPKEGETKEEKLTENLIRNVIIMRLKRTEEKLKQLRFIQEDIQQQGGIGLDTYQDLVMQLSLVKARLDQVIGSPIKY